MKIIHHLFFENGPLKGRRLAVPEDGAFCGRDSACELPIPEDTLSRRHARFFFRTGQLWVADQGSANGTLVNGQRVDSLALQRGDRVTIGEIRIRVLHAELTTLAGFKARVAGKTAAAETTPPAAPLWSLGAPLAWLALFAWWGLLAFSLCLPRPGDPAPESIETEPGAPAMPAAAPRPAPAPGPGPTPALPAAPVGLPAGARRDIATHVAQRLLVEDAPAAQAFLDVHLAAAATPDDRAFLETLRLYIDQVGGINDRIAAGLHAQAGKRIVLQTTNGPQPVRVVAVTDSRLRGRLIEAEGDNREVSVDVSRLHPADRLAWLGGATTAPDYATQCILNLRAGQRDAARAAAAQSGVLTEALLALIDGAPAGGAPR